MNIHKYMFVVIIVLRSMASFEAITALWTWRVIVSVLHYWLGNKDTWRCWLWYHYDYDC